MDYLLFCPLHFWPLHFWPKGLNNRDQKCTKRIFLTNNFGQKIPWSEVYKNCVSDQIQWSEMTKTFGHYCSLKMLWQIIIRHLDLEQSGAWISCHFGQIAHFLIKAPKLVEGVLYVSSSLDVEPSAHGHSGQWGLAHVQVWSIAETF